MFRRAWWAAVALTAAVVLSSPGARAQDAVNPPGWGATGRIGDPVFGTDGRRIGEVEDIYFDDQGRIVRILVDVEALAAGQDPVSVPWPAVETGPEWVRIAATPETVGRFPGGAGVGEPDIGVRRAGDLLGAQVQVGRQAEYGEVRDLVFAGGVLQSIVAKLPSGASVFVPAVHARIGPDAGYVVIELPPEQIAALETVGIERPAIDLPPLRQVPDPQALPSREALEEEMIREVQEWERRIAAYRLRADRLRARDADTAAAMLEDADELERAWRTLKLQAQKARVSEDTTFITSRSHYESARDQLLRKWQDAAGAG